MKTIRLHTDCGNNTRHHLPIILWAVALLFLLPSPGREAAAQNLNDSNFMEYGVTADGDTVYYAVLKPARVYDRLPRQKGRAWRKYYRLVYNFSQTYPYALEAKQLAYKTDSTFTTGKLSRRKKEKYIRALENDLFRRYEPVMRKMTVSQGKVLIKLISRETGMTPYEIIKTYLSTAAAGVWQGIAKLFDEDLKTGFKPDTNEEDAMLEDLVMKWEAGDFDGFYWSLFGQYPKIPVLPSKKK